MERREGGRVSGGGGGRWESRRGNGGKTRETGDGMEGRRVSKVVGGGGCGEG